LAAVVPLPDGAKLRRTWPQRFLLTFNVLVVLACFSAAVGLGVVRTKLGSLQRISLGSVLSSTADAPGIADPVNILLVGVDSEAGLDPDDPRMQDRDGGLRSDTIMLLRLDPENSKAMLLSFPRDLWLTLGDTGTKAKINAALPFGGPDLLIETIMNNFDVPVNHYVQVDFAQFEQLVNVVDGVDVPFDKPVRDEWTGLQIDEPGCIRLDGPRALDYVRSRYFEYFEDGEWVTDPAADLSRIRRQQDFIRRALERAVAKGVRNPFTLNALVNVALDSVTVDDQLTPQDIIGLARRFSSFNPANLELFPLPVYVSATADGTSIVSPIESEAKPILDRFRGIDAEAGSTEAVQLSVLNGTGRPNEGSTTAEGLRAVGFDVAAVGDADSVDNAVTVVRYLPEARAGAELVARYLPGGAVLEEDPNLVSAPVEVTTGLDFTGTSTEPSPTTTPTADGAGAATTVPAGDVTTTSGLGVVPGEGRTDICP
jgi:LCP family protein required for cell wall assembly